MGANGTFFAFAWHRAPKGYKLKKWSTTTLSTAQEEEYNIPSSTEWGGRPHYLAKEPAKGTLECQTAGLPGSTSASFLLPFLPRAQILRRENYPNKLIERERERERWQTETYICSISFNFTMNRAFPASLCCWACGGFPRFAGALLNIYLTPIEAVAIGPIALRWAQKKRTFLEWANGTA